MRPGDDNTRCPGHGLTRNCARLSRISIQMIHRSTTQLSQFSRDREESRNAEWSTFLSLATASSVTLARGT